MIAQQLIAQARLTPQRVFLRTAEGDLTYREAGQRSGQLAASLHHLGVRPGEPVLVLMHNSAEQVMLWFALSHLGAVHVPVNTALVGDGLAHTFRVTRAGVAVVDAALLPQLLALAGQLPGLQRLIVHGETPTDVGEGLGGVDVVAFPQLMSAEHPPVPIAEVDELAPAMMLFTSGTTGPSKACVLSHRYVLRQGQLHTEQLRLTADDVLYSPFPLFHIDAATLTVVAALAAGGTAAIGRRFSASRFWSEVRDFEATVFNFMGATLTILWKQQPSPRDRDHRVRLAWGVPMPDWKDDFEQRFGLRLLEVYGLTDAGVPVYDPLDAPHRRDYCGRVIPQFEVAIADEQGALLPPRQVGEILVRGREPGLVMNEYYAMPDATAAALRGGWFHTGDLGCLDGEGYLSFRGRSKDMIRRRGENISAQEVEQAVEAHPAVLEAAAVGVPSDMTEEDLKVFIVVRPGGRLDPHDVVTHLQGRLAAYMIPRYVEFLPELPRTPTEKVEKYRLRELGHTERTWDREAEGG